MKQLDPKTVEKVLGTKPDVFPEEGVVKVNFPRTDVKVAIDGRPFEPFMGLTSWAAFQPGLKEGVEAMLMGDMVLFEDEVNLAMSAALDQNLEVTALHNHFFFDVPKVYFMHIGGEGKLDALASGVRSILETTKALRAANPRPRSRFEGVRVPAGNAIDGREVEGVLSIRGQAKDGMFKVIIGRETKAACGCPVGKNMGVNTWAAFGGDNDNAVVCGDFAVLEEELQGVLRALRAADINVVAIHNHIILENPRFIFLHYWGRGRLENLCGGLRKALVETRDHKTGLCSCHGTEA